MAVNVRQLEIQVVGMVLVFMLALFVPAGTLSWPAGWLFLLLFFGFTVALTIWLVRFNPDLLAERLTGIGKPDQKKWDKVLLALTAVAFFCWLALMGMDAARFGWSHVPMWLQELGTILLLCSFYVFYITFRENPYLSPAVRIQRDRSHTVVSTGPYRYLRHPMYAGFVLFAIGTALLLGSWYGLLGTLLLIGLVARRAVSEEQALRHELAGYQEYMDRTKCRLVPNRATLCLVVLCSFACHVATGQINALNSGSWSGTIVYSSCNADEAFAESPECSRAAPGARFSLYDDTSRVIYSLEPQPLIAGHLGDSVTVHGTLDDATIHVVSIELMSIGLAVGQKAPAFAARDQFGRLQTFDTLKGSKGTVLLFFRSADW